MAHKKGGGTTRTNRDSKSKRLGVKVFGGQAVKSGNIIIRQKGNKVFPGIGTRQGNDFTIFATTAGSVVFKKRIGRLTVSVI
ncbi:MAG: 50S ribosomal protein L27 [Candidatus Daviesbacteria bacterium]|nr:MAG: 50S ribosomal protein L27 [Candidatus Daviesbacteria bacterium]